MKVDVRGIPVNCVVIGQGRPILLLHGWPADHRHMRLFFEPIFEGRSGPHAAWRRIYLDMPGMGETPGGDWIQTMDDLLEVPVAVMDALAPAERVVLAGHSWGGNLALGILRLRMPRIGGLMLSAPAVRNAMAERELPERRVFVPASAELAASLAEDERNWLNASVVQTPENLEGFRAGVLLGLRAADVPFLERVADTTLSTDGKPLPAPFDEPTLILTGRQDSLAGYRDALDILEMFPRATFAVLDRAGHSLRFEQAGLYAALVNEWLDRLELAASDQPA